MSFWKVIAAKINDTTAKSLRADSVTDSLLCIEYEHHEVHDGSSFFVKDYVTLGNGATQDFLLITPNTTKWGHLVYQIASEAEAHFEFYVNTTVSANGSAITSFNRNSNSATAAGILLYDTPTVTAVGTLAAQGKMGSGKSAGGTVRSANEIMLKQNTIYLIRVTNDTVSNNWIDYTLSWYEHTNSN